MTRSTLKHTLRRVYVLIALVLALSLFAKVADHVPGLAGTSLEALIPKLASGVGAFTVPGAGDNPPALLSASAVLAVLEREQARRTRE